MINYLPRKYTAVIHHWIDNDDDGMNHGDADRWRKYDAVVRGDPPIYVIMLVIHNWITNELLINCDLIITALLTTEYWSTIELLLRRTTSDLSISYCWIASELRLKYFWITT